MKNMKAKLMAALSMLIVAAIMMTSASFAWYTISKEVSLEKVDVSLGATKNLEIAKAKLVDGKWSTPGAVTLGGDEDSWGAKVTVQQVSFDFPAYVTSSATNVTLQSIQYGNDGRILSADQTTTASISIGAATYASDGYSRYYATITEGAVQAEKSVGYVKYVWIRSNSSGNITVSAVTSSGITNPAVDGNGNEFKTTTAATYDTTEYDMTEAEYAKLWKSLRIAIKVITPAGLNTPTKAAAQQTGGFAVLSLATGAGVNATKIAIDASNSYSTVPDTPTLVQISFYMLGDDITANMVDKGVKFQGIDIKFEFGE